MPRSISLPGYRYSCPTDLYCRQPSCANWRRSKRWPNFPHRPQLSSHILQEQVHRIATVIIIRDPSSRGIHMRINGEDSEKDGTNTLDFVALPTPPRHHYRKNLHIIYHQSNDNDSTVGSHSTLPTIPMFPIPDVVNRFNPAKGGDEDIPRSLNSHNRQNRKKGRAQRRSPPPTGSFCIISLLTTKTTPLQLVISLDSLCIKPKPYAQSPTTPLDSRSIPFFRL